MARFKFSSLKISHVGTMAFETFKIINKENTLYLHDLVTLLALKYNKYNFRYKYQQSRLLGMDWILLEILLQKLGMS